MPRWGADIGAGLSRKPRHTEYFITRREPRHAIADRLNNSGNIPTGDIEKMQRPYVGRQL
jgi:hypothetical protein